MVLHDAIYAQLGAFTSLYEIVLNGTVVSHYTHKILSLIPTLRVLAIVNCTFNELRTPFTQNNLNSMLFDYQNSPLSITYLSLHRLILPDPDLGSNQESYNHFLRFSNISTLSSLSLTWTQEVEIALAMFLQNFLEDDETWLFPNLVHLDIVLNSPKYLSTLVGFVKYHCPLGPRIQLSIEDHNMSSQQMNRIRPVRMSGLWSYSGPGCLLSKFRILPDLTHLIIKDVMEFNDILFELRRLPRPLQNLDIKVKKCDANIEIPLAIRDTFLSIRFLNIRYENGNSFVIMGSENLEIWIKEWDIEVLFAVRYRFPTIHSLIVQYRRGTLGDDKFIVILGSEILFHLPHLHTLKLLRDNSCVSAMPSPHEARHIVSSNYSGNNSHNSELRPTPTFDHAELNDYLNAWNSYCTQLRHLQVSENSWWVRRFEGDHWVKRVYRE